MGMNKRAPHLAAVITMIFWGLSYQSTRYVIVEIAPTLAVLYRFSLASLILYLILKIRRKRLHILPEDRVKIFLAGLTGVALNFTLENFGVKYTSTANVALLVATIPAITLIFENRRLHQKTHYQEAGGILISFIGIAVISLAQATKGFSISLFGDGLVLLSSVAWAAYTTLLSDLKGNYDSMEITLYTNVFGALCMVPTIFYTGLTIPGPKATFHLLYLVIFCSLIAYMLYMWALKRLGGIRINTYINIQPVVGLAASVYFLKEPITVEKLMGAAFIVFGVWIVNRSRAKTIVLDPDGTN